MRQSNFKRKFINLFLITAILCGDFSAFAQTRRGAASTSGNQTKKECNSGYSGTVSYTKTVSTSSSGRFGSLRTMKRVYQTQILIRDTGSLQGSVTAFGGGLNGSFNLTGRATASETESLNQTDVSEKDEYCNVTIKGRGNARRVHCESRLNRQSQFSGTSENANVFIGLRGRTIILSIGNLPKLVGTISQESSSSCSGTCTTQKPISSSASTETSASGERSAATDDNVIQSNPESFNRLSGSWTRTSTDGNTTETFQWNLSRCAAPLEIGDIRFEHKRVPNPDKWFGFDPNAGTIDGNIVKIKAKVFNNGGDTAYANVKFSETKSGESLPDAAVSIAVKPGEARDVEYEWDTNGYAWNENQQKESEREIKAELEGGNTETAKIKIKPKPIVMVHGLWANEKGWANYPIYLRNAHSYDWEGFAVGDDPAHGKMNTGDSVGNWRPTNTIFQNSQELGKQIKYVREKLNAWHVDIVAHSMGGLISRHYIHNFMATIYDGKPEATHLIMLGTPNQGSPCAYTVDGLFGMFGANEMMAIKELRPYSVNKFNQINTNRKGVKFSILAGYTVRTTCHEWGLGDGVVQLPSALYNISDRDYSRNIHTELTGKDDFQKFVLPRLAVGPKKARNEKTIAWLETAENNNFARQIANESDNRNGFNSYFQNAAFKRGAETEARDDETDASFENLTTRQKVVLKAKEIKEIEIPVRDGQHAGVLIVASNAVAAALFDEANDLIGKSVFDSPTATRELFRVINADRPIKNGVWRLKLENFDANEQIVYLAGWTNNGATSSFTVEAGKPSATGTISLAAKLTENNAPVLNVKITASLAGRTDKIEFFDDGRHNDGAANDGVYGATLEKLAKGEYFLEASATANNQTRNAVTLISVGGSNTAVKPAAKPRR